MTEQGNHPKLWLAYLLAVVLGQSGLYNLYLKRTGPAVVMSGAAIVAFAILVAAPSPATAKIVLAIFVVLTGIWIFDLVRMSSLVNSAKDQKLQEGSV